MNERKLLQALRDQDFEVSKTSRGYTVKPKVSTNGVAPVFWSTKGVAKANQIPPAVLNKLHKAGFMDPAAWDKKQRENRRAQQTAQAKAEVDSEPAVSNEEARRLLGAVDDVPDTLPATSGGKGGRHFERPWICPEPGCDLGEGGKPFQTTWPPAMGGHKKKHVRLKAEAEGRIPPVAKSTGEPAASPVQTSKVPPRNPAARAQQLIERIIGGLDAARELEGLIDPMYQENIDLRKKMAKLENIFGKAVDVL